MKTNFFQQIAGLGFNGNFLLNINQDETGVQTVSVVGILRRVTMSFRGKRSMYLAGGRVQQMLF